MNPTDHRPTARDETLLEEARLWSREVDGLRQSRALLTQRGVLWVLGLCAVLLLAIGLLSLRPSGGAGQPPMSVVWLVWIGAAGSLALLLVVWQLRVLPRPMLIALLLALCLIDVASVGINGLPALVFMPGLIVTLHVLLDHGAALRLAVLSAVGGFGMSLGFHPDASQPALLRLGTAIVGILIVMQLVARYWWRFTEATHRIGRELAALVQQLDTEIARTLAEKEQLRRTDPETGFLNRLGFEERARAWVDQGRPGARIAVIRLCQWEASMAPLPAPQQTALSEQLARTLRHVLNAAGRPDLVIGRMGLSEFWLLLPEEPGPETTPHEGAAGALLERLLERLMPPMTLTAGTALTQPRLGFARWPQDGATLAQLMARARWALEASVAGGQAEVRGFEPEMERLGTEQLALAAEFGRALALGQLELIHRPCALPDGRLAPRTEAQLCWNHPARGRLAAREFLATEQAPEQADAIMAWVLRQATGQAKLWRKRLSPDFEVAVDMPIAWALRSAERPEPLRALARELAWPAKAVTLKVAEDALLREPSGAVRALRLLQGLGLRIAIDRFGVGLSGFSHLRLLPASRLQIDGSLFAGVDAEPRREAVCSAVVQIGHAMGLEVMADGVCTPQEREALTRLGCDGLQGELLGAALSAAAFEARWTGPEGRAPGRA